MNDEIPETDPLTGRVLADKFRLERILGAGSMGRVYRATSLTDGRRVAIKLLLDQTEATTATRRGFEREAEVLAELVHPNIVGIIDHGEDVSLGARFLAMEYVDGTPLSDIVSRGRVEWPTALRVTARIADALQAAHDRGVLHRDVKPANIIVTVSPDGSAEPKLIDFGIALAADVTTRLTREGGLAGTPLYIAPELAQRGEASPRSDVYSLGVVLFELLTGTVPFFGETVMAVLLEKVESTPPLLRELAPALDVPDRVERLVASMLAPDPGVRPPSAAAVAQEIAAILDAPTTDLIPADVRDETATFSSWFPPGDLVLKRPQAPQAAATFEERSSRAVVSTPPLKVIGVPSAAISLLLVAGVVAMFVLLLSDDDEHTVTPVTEPPPGIIEPAATVSVSPQQTDDETAALPIDQNTSTPVKTDGGTADAPAKSDPTIRASPGCGIPARSGTMPISVPLKPPGWIHAPSTFEPEVPRPLVLMFNDGGTSPEQELEYRGFVGLADKQGLIVAAVGGAGITGRWDTDHIDGAVRTIEWIADRFCIDLARVYALGKGRGAWMADRLSCHIPLSAVALSGWRPEVGKPPCQPVVPTPMIVLVGKDDANHRPEGGKTCLGTHSVSTVEAENFYRKRSQCDGSPAPYEPEHGADCVTWSCAATLVSCTPDGGAVWPTQPMPLPIGVGVYCNRRYSKVDLTRIIWRFFRDEGRVMLDH